MTFRRGTLSIIEGLLLLAAVVCVSELGLWAHHWMWEQGQLLAGRTTMRDVARTIEVMRFRAAAQHRPFELFIDPSHGRFQLMARRDGPQASVGWVERTIWLPRGLQIVDAPTVLTVSPTGPFPTTSIIVNAPASERRFRLTTNETGIVQLDEESTL